ncbi:cation-transporting P-type ATPase [Sphingosinicella sp.]|uniref:cation-transporting P-type ATPase n=1 Tax=Sphingosinicella sp. TaxID=1917971 RepID=UPI00261CED81|nr:cation-transporting P-type ATPase [Sphingosinicella sp.]
MDRPAPTHPSPHAASAAEMLAYVGSSELGLSNADAERRRAASGANRLPVPPRRSALRRFLAQFNNILIYVLIAAAVLTAGLGHASDAGVILAVVLANAVIGFIQEGRAERAMDAIREMLAPRANVLRGGTRLTIAAEDLVPGDVVLLDAGDRVPADIRLFRARGLAVQEAVLTGESVPVEKHSDPVAADVPLGDRTGMAFSGTLVTSGLGRGVVVATGAATEIGRVSGLLSQVEPLTTPLVRQMDVFARWLTLFILFIAALLLLYGSLVAGRDFAEMFMIVVGLSVAAIPEGLPAVLTITLAVGVQAMARRNAIVRHLPAIETLGAVSVICTDKTGTLTRNEMMAASVSVDRRTFVLEGDGYAPTGKLTLNGTSAAEEDHPGLQALARAAAACNDAGLRHQEGTWNAEGDPMEAALLAFAAKIGVDWQALRHQAPRSDVLPFDARHRFMATLNRTGGGGVIYVKGAPERIVAMCGTEFDGTDEQPIDRAYWRAEAERIASGGERVLAFAMRRAGPGQTTLEPGDLDDALVMLGLVGLIDPPRPEAVAAVAECRAAGIRVKMITGDHAGTAAAIGRHVGLANPARVLTGTDLDRLDDAALADAVLDVDVFARTSPEHKLRLVMALQARGLTVAMTGDGVNDAPALKRADAGIAMGCKGSEAAKEAASLVLADDNFASIAAAVREGRTVYENIRKVISWTLPTNAGEAVTIIFALLFGLALPVTPIQILWVNMVTDVTLGLALAFEPADADTMRRPPRPRSEPLLTRAFIWHIVLVSGLFLAGVLGMYSYAVERGHSVETARTIAVNTLVVMEIFHLFYIRNLRGTSLSWRLVRGTRVVWAMVGLVTAAQFAITYVPVLQRIFGTAAVPLREGLLVVGVGAVMLAIIEAEKQLRLAFARPRDGAA